MKAEDYLKPWMLVQNQIRSAGGYAMDIFRGRPEPKDIPNGSEAWVGSVTRANGATAERPNFGCAEVVLPDGTKHYLVDVINSAPMEILGAEHIEKYGNDLGVLVKLLDAKDMYFLQCHPTREVAEQLWDSKYGKEECWYVISVREDYEEKPYILLGFKEGISREKFEELFHTATLKDLENLCHKIYVKPGEAYFVPGGCPHALGAGCLVAEIQEPSDLGAIAIPQSELIDYRRKAAPGAVFTPIDEELYENRTFGSFIYEGCTENEIVERCKSKLPVIRQGEGWAEYEVFGKGHTPYFACTIYEVDNGSMPYESQNGISIGIVLKGSGSISCGGYEMKVKQGDEIFMPYNVADVKIEGRLSLIVCRPGE